MAGNMKPGGLQFAEFMQNLSHPDKLLIEKICSTVLSAHQDIQAHIKWNAPAFEYNGAVTNTEGIAYNRDILVLNLRQKGHILLIFPSGVRIGNTDGFLEGSYADGRRMLTIKSEADLFAKQVRLKTALLDWIKSA